MTDTYSPGTPISLVFPLTDLSGNVVVPTGLQLVVTDENEDVVYTGVVALPEEEGLSEITVIVPASANVSSAQMTVRGAELQITVADASAPISAQIHYLLRASTTGLIVPTNSFQTYKRALIEAAILPNILSWGLATEADRLSALQLAYAKLIRYRFVIWNPGDDDDQSLLRFPYDNVVSPRMWPVMTSDEFNAYGEHFKKAIRQAQVVEADEILSGDVIGQRRANGLLSETIGESSMMFRSGKPLDRTVSKRAFTYISSFVRRDGIRIGRA